MREDSSSLASPDPEYTAQTRVLELELQGVTRADNGQDCCRLVTRDRNLPINQHDRSRSPGTSERRASSCRWRPRRPQSPECWLQGLYFLATVWKQTAIVKGQNLRRTNDYALFKTTNLIFQSFTAQNSWRTLGRLTQVVLYQPMVFPYGRSMYCNSLFRFRSRDYESWEMVLCLSWLNGFIDQS